MREKHVDVCFALLVGLVQGAFLGIDTPVKIACYMAFIVTVAIVWHQVSKRWKRRKDNKEQT